MPSFSAKHLPPAILAQLVIAAVLLLELWIVFYGPSAAEATRELTAALSKPGSTSSWEAEADLGIHYAAKINLWVLTVLALLAGWWTRPFQQPLEADPLHRETPPAWQRYLLPVVLVLGFAGIYAATSFGSRSLWWDEMWAMKQCVHGTWKPDKKNPDQLKFQPTTWKRCAFYYQKPTNHAPMSLAQKASLSVWRTATGAPESEFTELAVRAPALLASGLAVFLLMRLVGAAQGIGIGALMLLLHPWHLRYGVDARAYAFVVPLCISGIAAARKVVFSRGRNGGAWVWLGLNQALWIWTYPNAVLDVLLLFVVLAVLLWRYEENTRDRFTALIRLTITHVFAAALWMQLFLPNLMQARHWAGQENQGHQLSASIAKDTVASLTLGMNWQGEALDKPEGKGLLGAMDFYGSEAATWGVIGALLLLSFLGLRWAIKYQPRTGWLLAAPCISAAIYTGLGAALGLYFYPRFIIALLPVFVAGLCLSGQAFTIWTQMQRKLVLCIMVLFAVSTNYQRGVYMARPYSGFKEAARAATGWSIERPGTPAPLVVCYGLGREVASVYYRDVQPVENAAELSAASRSSRDQGRDLLVLQGYSHFNRAKLADGMAMLDDRAQFDELGVWPGIEPDFLFRLLKAR